MKIEKLLKETESIIYGGNYEVNGVTLKRYLPYAQKVGLATRLVKLLLENEVYDGVNGKMFVPVFLFKESVTNLEFPKNLEEIDVDGVYDYLCISETLENGFFQRELNELNSIVNELVKIEYRKKDIINPLDKLIEEASGKTLEEIEKMQQEAKDLLGKK